MFLHTHGETQGVVSVSDDHNHSHDNHHYHTHAQDFDWLAWAKGLLGDFDHQDLGENHFELFLRSGNTQSLVKASVNACQSPMLLLPNYQGQPDLGDDFCKTKPPNGAFPLSDSPFLDAGPSRAPPVFS